MHFFFIIRYKIKVKNYYNFTSIKYSFDRLFSIFIDKIKKYFIVYYVYYWGTYTLYTCNIINLTKPIKIYWEPNNILLDIFIKANIILISYMYRNNM